MKNQKQANHNPLLLKMELKILQMQHQHGNKYYFQMLEKGFEVITKAEYEEVEKKFNLLAY